jgi:hypothetical protein
MPARSTADSDSNAPEPGLGMMISNRSRHDTTKVFVVCLGLEEPTNSAQP